MKMPNCNQAIIPTEKILDYLLDEENSRGKSIFFNQFGYFKHNFDCLYDDLTFFACKGKVLSKEMTKFGKKYVVYGELLTPINRKIELVTVWIFRNTENFPRFITAYPK